MKCNLENTKGQFHLATICWHWFLSYLVNFRNSTACCWHNSCRCNSFDRNSTILRLYAHDFWSWFAIQRLQSKILWSGIEEAFINEQEHSSSWMKVNAKEPLAYCQKNGKQEWKRRGSEKDRGTRARSAYDNVSLYQTWCYLARQMDVWLSQTETTDT